MKRYLVDTHIFLWWLVGDNKLEDIMRSAIENPHNQVYVSVATLWEICIKHALGKLPLRTSISEMISVSGLEILSITSEHIVELEKLPLLHNDPFDRMLISQAKAENLTFISVDSKIKKYDVVIL